MSRQKHCLVIVSLGWNYLSVIFRMGRGIVFGSVEDEVPVRLVEVGDIVFVNDIIAEEYHKGHDTIGATCDNGKWYILVRYIR